MGLRLEVRGVVETQARLRQLVANLEDMTDLWADYAGIMVATEQDWFASEGDGLWPPLDPRTIAEKLRHGFPADPLIRTGDLLASLTDPAQAMDVGQGRSTIGTFTRSTFSWGTDVADERGREYAHYHQHSHDVTGEPLDYGTHPPERQVIPWPLPPEVEAQMDAANERFAERAIEESGL